MDSSTSPGPDVAARHLVSDYSLEMTGKDIPGLHEARDLIPPGTLVNITFLGNENTELRLAAARAVLDCGFTPVPHISARRLSSRKELDDFLARLQDIGASERVFLIGGDPSTPEGPFESSHDVIKSQALTGFGVRHVGIAGYPEGHPDISQDTLWQALTDKSTALADQGLGSNIITQFAFDTEPVMRWIESTRARGIAADIRIGTPGPAGIKRLLAFARRFGVGSNAMIVKKYGFSLGNLLGSAGPDRFVTDLAEALTPELYGDVSLHFYTFGGVTATATWADRFLDGSAGEDRA